MILMWQFPPQSLVLSENNVHLWRANLDLPEAEIEELESLLSSDEQARADRFRFPQHRRRFIAARGILRQIIASYEDIKPNLPALFEYSPLGKPRLSVSLGDRDLQFNVSHSNELALYSFTRRDRIGIDLESEKLHSDVIQIAQRFFTTNEATYLAGLTEDLQIPAFLQIWTAKEAYLKATGEGIANSLNKVEIALDRDLEVSLVTIGDNTSVAENWLMTKIFAAENYLATLAVETQERSPIIELWSWN
jgi:4'-phosphopantetheinyl transferase